MRTAELAPAVSVVIPTYMRAASLDRLLSKLESVDAPRGGFEVIVVDDGSSDRTADVVSAAPIPVRYVRQDNSGAATARNRGWQLATAPIVVFTDDDCVPSSGWLVDMVAALDANPEFAAVGGAIRPLVDGFRARFVQAERLVDHGAGGERGVRYLVTANMIARREVLEALDGFDERFPVGEDTDFGARVRASGRTLAVIDGGVVAHDHRLGLREILATYRKAGRARRLLAERHRELSAQAGTRSVARPAHWCACYRRYRAEVGPIMALGFLALRAAGIVSFAHGYLVDGRRDQRQARRSRGVRDAARSNGSSRDVTPTLAVVELDPAGHRLAYVRAFVDESSRTGAAVRVVTTPAARQSAEWHEHLGDVDASVAVRLEQPPRSAWQHARLIRRSSPCVVLDSDARLPALILSRLIGARFGVLVTRPLTPKLDPRWRLRSLGKTMLCLTLRALGVNVRLLVSPFTTEHPWEEIAIPACLRLPTVVDPPLIPRSGRSRADARHVLDVDTNARVWAVAGVINDTKDLPTILRAMTRLAPDHHLVVAGKQDARAADEIARHGSDLEAAGRLIIIDRTMTAAELADVLRAADGVLVIKGSGLSSGIAIGAIANGTRVICTASNPRSGPGFVPFDGSIDDLAGKLASLEPGVVITGGEAHDDGKRSLLSLLPFGSPTACSPAVVR